MEQINPEAQSNLGVIQLSAAETAVIMMHAMVRRAAEKLPVEEQDKIKAIRNQFYAIMETGGDAARVALQLFTTEYDNTAVPYGELFETMDMVPFEEALQMWQDGYNKGAEVIDVEFDE